MTDCFIAADWPAPGHIHAGTTTRLHGYSKPPFDSFNLAYHVGDSGDAVAKNRARLRQQLTLPNEPAWLDQVHGREIIHADKPASRTADAAWTTTPGQICAVLTADCLPLLLTDQHGSCIAAVHVGWRGLVAGIVGRAVNTLPVAAEQCLAWLGPCIGPRQFEVSAEVFNACQEVLPNVEPAFKPNRPGHWLADLPMLTRLALAQAGVRDCHSSRLCTYSEPARFFSHRRDGPTGRMANLIWMDAGPG